MSKSARHIVCALIAFLATPAFVAGQTSPPRCGIQGVARDSTGLVLPGVVITTTPGEVSATSDDQGSFCLAGLPPGQVTIVASLEGFQPDTRQVTIAARSAAVTLDVILHPAGFRDEIVVKATRTSRRLDEVPVRTEVVDTARMRAIGARTLADAVEYTTGVRVESNCQNCNFSQIRLLGLEGPYTQILMDGQPVISSLAQVYGIEQIPSRMIERIEIVKGGGSALYGSGSVGGVVNVIPREPSRSGGLLETRVDLSHGVPNYSNSGSFDWASTDRSTNATAFVQLDDVKPLDVTGDGFTEVCAGSRQGADGPATICSTDARS